MTNPTIHLVSNKSELRDTFIRLNDGLAGTCTVEEALPAQGDTDCDVNTVSLNTETTNLIPVGARFTHPASAVIHTVTARVPVDAGPTTNITFSPAWDATPPSQSDVLTFQSQQLEIKIGEGNLTYTEAREMEYLRDRGDLDTVREGDQQPLDVSLEFVYEHVVSGSGEDITPPEALKRINKAEEWVSSSDDPCEPYCVDIEIFHEVPCGADQDETTVLPDFRYESLEFNLSDATIAVSGKCNTTVATITRS